ncbi:MAG: VTT domain-containing protein [Trueperaceae bacterium]
MRRIAWRYVVPSVWLALLAAYLLTAWGAGLSPWSDAPLRAAFAWLDGNPWAPLAFVAIYALRPLLFLSATLLSIAAGAAFGVGLGLVVTVIGATSGAALAYALGAWAGRGVPRGFLDGRWSRWTRRIRTATFESVFLMRLAFVPYDVVNYGAGAARARFLEFFAATVLGSAPGTLTFVLAGASTGGLARPTFDVRLFLASLALFAVSVTIARLLRRRARHQATSDAATTGRDVPSERTPADA